MTLVLRILLLIGALFAMGIVINSVHKSKIRISDSVYWIVSAGILVLFALIPQLAYFFSGLFGKLCLTASYCHDSYQALSSVLRNLQAHL